MSMTPRTESHRPIRRSPSPWTPRLPAGAARVAEALRPYRPLLKPQAEELFSLVLWRDLHSEHDARRLADAVKARLGLRENAKYLVDRGPLDVAPPVGSSAGSLRPLHRPPVGVEDRP